MKINIKNLKGEVFYVDIEPSQTIAELKEKIKAEKGHSVESQKIIFKGKTTNNEDQIEKLGLKETDFLVVMTQIAKPQPKPKVEEKVQVQPSKQQQKKEAKQDEKSQNKNSADTQQNQAQISELMSMGFPRAKCQAALKAAFNNSERAVQYLLNGIPANSGGAGQQGQGNLAQGIAGLLPQLDMIRQTVRNDPNSLQGILDQLATSNPELYNVIAQRPQQFERLIMEDGDLQQEYQGQQIDVQGQGDQGELVVTQQQEQAINRLAALGFSKIEAAQAYVACDKNEEMAANLLFDRLANGDIQPGQGQSQSNGDDDDDNMFN